MSQAGDYGVTRRASSAISSVPKVSRKLLLQNVFLQPVPAMNDNSSVTVSLQDKVVYVQFLVSQLKTKMYSTFPSAVLHCEKDGKTWQRTKLCITSECLLTVLALVLH